MDKIIAYFINGKMYKNVYYTGGLNMNKSTKIVVTTAFGNSSIFSNFIKTSEDVFKRQMEQMNQLALGIADAFKPMKDLISDLAESMKEVEKFYDYESEIIRCDWQIKKKVSCNNLFSRKQNRKLLHIRSNC